MRVPGFPGLIHLSLFTTFLFLLKSSEGSSMNHIAHFSRPLTSPPFALDVIYLQTPPPPPRKICHFKRASLFA